MSKSRKRQKSVKKESQTRFAGRIRGNDRKLPDIRKTYDSRSQIFKAFLREPMHDNFVLPGTYYVAGHYADAKCIKEVLRVQNGRKASHLNRQPGSPGALNEQIMKSEPHGAMMHTPTA